jgi:hypothetical protein
MKSRPILFSAPMVRALLDGSKTQTRRVVSKNDAALLEFLAEDTDQLGQKIEAGVIRVWCDDYPEEGSDLLKNRYGTVGDQLWVRETWYCDDFRVQRGPYLKPDDLDVTIQDGTLVYAADGLTPYEAEQPVWKPSIHMPRWVSRITLEITSVRVERLQDISEADAAAEGWTRQSERSNDPEVHQDAARDWYSDLWEQINGAGSWALNPWVWVIEFKKVKP